MALNKMVANFLARALAAGAFPPGGDLLEFGESIVVPYDTPQNLLSIVAPHIPVRRLREAERRVEAAAHSKSMYQHAYGPARAFYHAVFGPAFYMAIELGLAPRRLCVDLNTRVEVTHLFDYVINNGTSEHIFDQANIYRAIHEYTRLGGVMIHWTPCLGGVNHGMFHIQPGFLFDLAAANGYEIELIGLARGSVFFPLLSGEGYRQGIEQHTGLAESSICAVLRKTLDEPFKAPIQGSYQGGPTEAYALSKVPRQYATVGRPNVALHKPALQSSTSKWSWHDDPAQDAAGGNNGMITGYYGFHTEPELEPWWMVDLGLVTAVHEVVVYNRIDTIANARNRAAYLRISFSDDGASWTQVFQRGEPSAFGGADGWPLRVPFEGCKSRFIRLSLPGKTSLHLDEIEVY